ncbi:hypothetical protein [Halorubrum ezzemoulense]|uniref:Uncharacterized protein n=1 Tax=Halorubrum ezzemoulense TaxID=337243 RepID=A0A256J6J3_HALEZ|nr:hypothetical protein [Halorubrum ezzemoulense]OYR64430.1 hypothetical protein DJ80_05355 [Halorubrum ezzemoulense]
MWDVARAYVRSAKRLLGKREKGETGTETCEIAIDESMGVMGVGEIVQEAAREERGIEVDVKLVEKARADETMVEEFGVDISAARETLGWKVRESVAGAVRER